MSGHNDFGTPSASNLVDAESVATAEAADQASIDGALGTPSDAPTDVASLVRQRDEYQDLLLRRTAEFDNYRKRIERERKDLADHINGEFAKDLLPVVDDFQRALAAPVGSDHAYRQGTELVFRRLMDALAKRGISVIDPLGETFDPHLHEAIARVPSDVHRDGEIVEVFSRGFKLGDRLLRPAMVKVATS